MGSESTNLKKNHKHLTKVKHTCTPFNDLFPGLLEFAGTRKVKTTWILLWHQLGRQITMPATHHSVFTGRMPFLPRNQQRQSTEGKPRKLTKMKDVKMFLHL